MSTFCRHNRFMAECPICAKGTVLDPNRSSSRTRSPSTAARKPGARRASAGAKVSRGVFASAGPYDDGREIHLEKVPGGLRLAAWHAGQLLKTAPVLRVDDLPALLHQAAEREVLSSPALDIEARAPGLGAHAASPGRTGELRDELRVERVDAECIRIARWIMRPNRGWELQEAPVMLPPARFSQALERAASAGVLGEGAGSTSDAAG